MGGAMWSSTGNGKPPEHDTTVRDIERRSLASNVRFWRGLDKRCLGTNRYFREVRHGDVAGHVVADVPKDVFKPFFDDPDNPERFGLFTITQRQPETGVCKESVWLLCQECKKEVTLETSHLDHIRPYSCFKMPVNANAVGNLRTLCIDCHRNRS